ncbi:MAG: PRC-barrel domain containing protein [Hyphomicrobiales bacterium]|nr:MAG: PRC-barrel domain containing protein [Hyphomicrobiales bacterium]
MKPKRYAAAAALVFIAQASVAHAQQLGVEQEVVQSPPAGVPTVVQPTAKTIDKDTLVGLDVFSQDQTRVGSVEKVVAGADGSVAAIQIKTGGFLGFGARLVSIPHAQFSMRGPTVVQLQLTSEEVARMPAVKDPS